MAKERLSLYFDTDIPSEKKMWDYICKDGKNRKSYNVKKALEIITDGAELISSDTNKKNELIQNEEPVVIKTDINEDLSDEDLPF